MPRTNRSDLAAMSALEGASELLDDLLSQQADLTAQIEQLQREERVSAIASIQKQILLYELSAAELGFGSKMKKPQKRNVDAKYRDPESGASWSGRGKSPRWIAGQDRTAFLIG